MSGKEVNRKLTPGRVIVALIVIGAVFWGLSSVFGSGGGNAPSSSTAGMSSANLSDLPWGSTATWNDVAITVSQPLVDSTAPYTEAGTRIVFCDVTIANRGDEATDYNGLYFSLVDAEHQAYDDFALTDLHDLGSGSLAPAETVKGVIAFELQGASKPAGIKWRPDIVTETKITWGQP
jgi:hypothetical protein